MLRTAPRLRWSRCNRRLDSSGSNRALRHECRIISIYPEHPKKAGEQATSTPIDIEALKTNFPDITREEIAAPSIRSGVAVTPAEFRLKIVDDPTICLPGVMKLINNDVVESIWGQRGQVLGSAERLYRWE
jgi:hypothetical protein